MSGVQRINTGEKVWLSWKCEYCGTTVSGKYRECPNCGRPRGGNTNFDINDIGEDLTKEEIANRCGPDWFCECCETLNSARFSECESCGAPRGASKNYFEMKAARESKFAGEFLKDTAEQFRSIPVLEDDITGRKVKKRKIELQSALIGLFSALGIGTLAILMVVLFTPKEYQVTVTDVSWYRSISIEQQGTYHESGWTVPVGGRQTSKEWKYVRTDKVIDHYDTKDVTKTKTVEDGYDVDYEYVDNGDGSADRIEVRTPRYKTVTYTETESVPVYKDVDIYDWYYYYDIDRWKYHHSVETSGQYDPYWGEVNLGNRQRQGGTTETYYIHVNEEGLKDKYTVSYDDWCMIKPGDNVTIKVSIIGNAVITEVNGVKLVE